MKFTPFIIKTNQLIFRIGTLLPIFITASFINTVSPIMAQEITPVLEFPQIGLDDTSTYSGYTTRFFKDSESNTVQISIKRNTGRVMNIWADAANESISFTLRDAEGQPDELKWGSKGARAFSRGTMRYLQYKLASKKTSLDVGHFILSSMRIERDFQYSDRHSLPFDSEAFIVKEFTDMISSIEQLPANIGQNHLAILNSKSLEEIRSRLVPQIKQPSKSRILVEQSTLDGKNRLTLEISVDSAITAINLSNSKISFNSLKGQPIQLSIKIGTNSPSLTPLNRKDIFNNDFFKFYERAKTEHDSLSGISSRTGNDLATNERLQRFPRLERQVKSMELLSSKEKLMAGLPNFATYFGRDMMMSALMLEPVWNPAMLEHVIASVLKKLTPTGEVSHEEGLGGQAIRENGVKYSKLIADYLQLRKSGDKDTAKKFLADAAKILANLQAVTENYHMVDDDFQLPVLTSRYLSRSDVPAERKRMFLLANAGTADGTSRLTLLLRNLLYVSRLSRPYAASPAVNNLISFEKIDEQRWRPGSWRDSGNGYANGRYAMDINVVWVPKALESIEIIFSSLGEIGISHEEIQTALPEILNTTLLKYLNNLQTLQQAKLIWRSALQYFRVQLSPQKVQEIVQAKLNWLPEQERAYWENNLAESGADKDGIEFLALSLNDKGRPIPVVNTDLATWLFLEDLTGQILEGKTTGEEVLKRLRIIVRLYPAGLLIKGLGPVVANDAYASPKVWENFKHDIYHSPRVVWGREVNLLFLGLAKQIRAAYDSQGRIKDTQLESFVQELRSILDITLNAVKSSGLKHNELWSYRILKKKLLPSRYSTTSDIQLWNLTDLAVQYLLEDLKK